MTLIDLTPIGNEFFVKTDNRLSIFGLPYNVNDYKYQLLLDGPLDTLIDDKLLKIKNWLISNNIDEVDYVIVSKDGKQKTIFIFKNNDDFVLFKMRWI